MRNVLFQLSLLMIAISGNLAHASADTQPSFHTLNVSLDQIHLTKDGIFVCVDRHFYPVKAIFSDQYGNYSCHLDYHYVGESVACSKCGYYYDQLWFSACPKCGNGGGA